MLEVGNKVTINEGALGYCHPDMQDEYTMRLTFHGNTPGEVVKVPEKEDNAASVMVKVDIFPEPDNYFCFKSADLTLVSE